MQDWRCRTRCTVILRAIATAPSAWSSNCCRRPSSCPLSYLPGVKTAPGLASALLLYSSVCPAALLLWPGFNARYAMPIAPSLAVLAGMGWDLLAKSNYSLVRWVAVTLLCAFIVYRFVLVAVIMPVFSDRFGASRNDGMMLERAISGESAPAYCFGLDTNQLFYVRKPLQCLDESGQKSLSPPAWLLIPRSAAESFARLRLDLEVRFVVETASGPQLDAVRVDQRSGEKLGRGITTRANFSTRLTTARSGA
jgi:hypothetical protein